jgi:hypothetical protein
MELKKGQIKDPKELEKNITKKKTKKKTSKKTAKKTTRKKPTKADIDSLIADIETKEPTQENLPKREVAQGERDLVSSEFYDNGMTPILDNYLPDGLVLTEEEKALVTKGMKNLSTGLRASMPITCYGDKCPFKRQCPLHKLGKAPVGKECPIESMLLDLYSKRYIDEFDVTSDLMSEVTTMTMLAATHVLEMRAFILLGQENEEGAGATGLIRNVVGYDDDEKPIVQLQEHPAYNQLERAWRWRRNLLESLVGTRKEKYKKDAAMQDRSGESVSQAAANLKSTIDKFTVVDITPNK